MEASLTSMDSTRESTWGCVSWGERVEGVEGYTLEMAELRVGLGAELFAPKRRFIFGNSWLSSFGRNLDDVEVSA